MKSLRELAKEAYDCAVSHGFWEYESTNQAIPIKLMLIVSECSEAMEAFRKKVGEELVKALGEELADVIIRTIDLAQALKIDIQEEVERKIQINKERPFRYGWVK